MRCGLIKKCDNAVFFSKKNHLGYSRALTHYPVLCLAVHVNKADFHVSDRLKKQEKLLNSKS